MMLCSEIDRRKIDALKSNDNYKAANLIVHDAIASINASIYTELERDQLSGQARGFGHVLNEGLLWESGSWFNSLPGLIISPGGRRSFLVTQSVARQEQQRVQALARPEQLNFRRLENMQRREPANGLNQEQRLELYRGLDNQQQRRELFIGLNHDQRREIFTDLNYNQRRELFIGLNHDQRRQFRIHFNYDLNRNQRLELYVGLDDQQLRQEFVSILYDNQKRQELYLGLNHEQRQELARSLNPEQRLALYQDLNPPEQ